MPGWTATARFDGARLNLTPQDWGCTTTPTATLPARSKRRSTLRLVHKNLPVKLGSSKINGQISLMIPNGDRLFALGNTYDCQNELPGARSRWRIST